MKHSIPTADVLLDAVTDFLERDLAPTLDGYHRFQTRIAINVLKTVVRELRLEPRTTSDVSTPDDSAVCSPTHDAALDLANQRGDGSLPRNDAELVARLRALLRRQLAVDNPAWIPPIR